METLKTKLEVSDQTRHVVTGVKMLQWLTINRHKVIARLFKVYCDGNYTTSKGFAAWVAPIAEAMEAQFTDCMNISRGFRFNKEIIKDSMPGAPEIIPDHIKHVLGLGETGASTMKKFEALTKNMSRKEIVELLS